MAGMEEELRDRWAADAGRSRAAATALDSLLGRYREPQRRYHGLAHVLRVLRTLDDGLCGDRGARPGGGSPGRLVPRRRLRPEGGGRCQRGRPAPSSPSGTWWPSASHPSGSPPSPG